MSQSNEPSLVESARTRVSEFASQLRMLSATDQRVPNLDWTVAELGQHVASLPAYWQNQDQFGADFERPDDFAAFSDQARAHISETDPQELANRVEAEFDSLLSNLDVDADRWVYAIRSTGTTILGFAISELVLHGRDLAAITGVSPPSFSRAEANAAVAATMVTAPFFVDGAKAQAQPNGVYHLSFRGGNDYTWTKRGAELHIEPGRPDKADARLNADPATFVLSSLGRIGQLRAGMSGKLIAYGRRPWRFMGLGTITVDGV